MGTIHPECRKIDNEIKLLQQELIELSDELDHAAPGQKPAIAAQIKKINAQISAKRRLFNLCMIKHPLPAPVTSVLTGNIGLWFSPSLNTKPATPTITFSGYKYADVELQFPDILFPNAIDYNTILGHGSADIVLSMIGGKAMGGYNIATHNMSIRSAFKITATNLSGFLSVLIKLKTSNLRLASPGLTTSSVPSPLTPSGTLSGTPLITSPGQDYGKIKLVGAGVITDGMANGNSFAMELSGHLNQVP